MPNIKFAKADGLRIKITKKQKREIRNMYKEVAKSIDYRVEMLSHLTNISSQLQTIYLNQLASQIEVNVNKLNNDLKRKINDNMKEISQSVVDENKLWLEKVGFELKLGYAYSHVPNDIIEMLTSGKFYKGKWNLSTRIWGTSNKIEKDLGSIIAKGMAEQKSTYEIAKDLERYVNPRARKSWEWNKVYPGTNKIVDYNAQRLARTMVSHAYEQSFVRVTQNNPFFEAYRWVTSNSDRVCPICIERAEDDQFGLGPGIFPKDQLPLDHPNGMCTFEVVQTKSFEEIGNILGDYVNGNLDIYAARKIDNFVKDFENN